jgi:hypothetical protein
MAGIATVRWCEFATKGAEGGLAVWHLVQPEGEESHRSVCGWLFTEKPQRCLDKAPDAVRGVCRKCAKFSLKRNIPPALQRR